MALAISRRANALRHVSAPGCVLSTFCETFDCHFVFGFNCADECDSVIVLKLGAITNKGEAAVPTCTQNDKQHLLNVFLVNKYFPIE